jgi:hypothetical protein
MRTDRLLLVARALRESKHPEDFRMVQYGNDCGTPACAFGHYAAREDLQDKFTLDAEGDTVLVGRRARPVSFVCFDSKVVLDHFGIDIAAARRLFGHDGCGNAETTIEAAEYIERFCEHAKDEP